MSVDFDKYPHLVSQIEVFSVTEANRGIAPIMPSLLEENARTSSSTIYHQYLRYRYLNPSLRDGLLIEAVTEGRDDEYGSQPGIDILTREFEAVVDENIVAASGMPEIGLVSFASIWNPYGPSKRVARLALAGLFGYEPGLEVLDIDKEKLAKLQEAA